MQDCYLLNFGSDITYGFWHFILKAHRIDKTLVAYAYSSAYYTFGCAPSAGLSIWLCINATRALYSRQLKFDWIVSEVCLSNQVHMILLDVLRRLGYQFGIWSMSIKTFWFSAFNCLNESDYVQCFCVGLCCTIWFDIWIWNLE